MRKKLLSIMLLAFLGVSTLVGCGNGGGGGGEPPVVVVDVTGVELNKNTLDLAKGASEQLTATVSPEDASNKAVTWKSSNEGVVTVDKGLVTAKNYGEADVTVKTVDGGFTAKCHVTVNVVLESLEITNKEEFAEFGASQNKQLNIVGNPQINPNAMIEAGYLVITSSDPEVASISGLTVFGLKAGTTTIKAELGGKSDEFELTVSDKIPAPAIVEATPSEVMAADDTNGGKIYHTTGYVISWGTKDEWTQYGEMTVGDTADAKEGMYVYGSYVEGVTFTWNDVDKYTIAYTERDVLTNEMTKDLKIGDKVEMNVIRSDYNTTKEVKGQILSVEKGQAAGLTGITVPETAKTSVGNTTTVKATPVPANAEISEIVWTVEEGLDVVELENANEVTVTVKGLKAGTAKIKATASTFEGICTVTVEEAIPQPELVKGTIAEFIADDKGNGKQYYEITGEVTKWKDDSATDGTQYGNFYLKQDEAEVYIYGASATAKLEWDGTTGAFKKFSNPKDFLTNELTSTIKIGSKVTMLVTRCDYNTTIEGNGIVTAVENAPVEKVNVKFQAPAEWAKVYAYAWEGNEKNAEWPGLEMTAVAGGDHVFGLDIPVNLTSVVFNDGDQNKTGDLTINFEHPFYDGNEWKDFVPSYPQPELVKGTIAQFIADTAGNGKQYYEITGEVTAWASGKTDGTKYGNFYLKQDEAEVYIYGASATGALEWDSEKGAFKKFSNPQDFLTNELTSTIVIGSKVTMLVTRCDYNGTIEGNGVVTAVENAPVVNKLTFYYDNSQSQWDEVYAYAWNAEGNNTWPGEKMAAVENENNIFSIELADTYTSIIFNKGEGGDGNQTANLTIDPEHTFWNGSAWADFVPGQGGGGEQGDNVVVSFTQDELAGASPIVKNDVTLTNTSNYGTTVVTELRVYKNQTLKVAGKDIIKIEMTCTKNGTTKQGPGCFGAGAPEGYTFEADGPKGTWEGKADEVSFTASSDQVRIIALVVTMAKEEQPVEIAQPDGNFFGKASIGGSDAMVLVALGNELAHVEVGSDKVDATYTFDKATGLVTIELGGLYGKLTATFDPEAQSLKNVGIDGQASAAVAGNGEITLTLPGLFSDCEGSAEEMNAIFAKRPRPSGSWTALQDVAIDAEHAVGGKQGLSRAGEAGEAAVGICLRNDFATAQTFQGVGFWVYNPSASDITLRTWIFKDANFQSNAEIGQMTAKAGQWTFCRMGFTNGATAIRNINVSNWASVTTVLTFDNFCLY